MNDNRSRGRGVGVSWDRRYRAADAGAPQPAAVLQQNAHLLPAHGVALDLACGLGGNALCLARQNLTTTAWDASAVAIDALRRAAGSAGVSLLTQVRDVVAEPPAPSGFDVIVVSHFLERALCPALIDALRAGGLLFYQTFTRDRVDDSGPRNPDYRLQRNELLTLFRGLEPLVYREEGLQGDLSRGFRSRAMLVARRR